jgi:hypothetical protein
MRRYNLPGRLSGNATSLYNVPLGADHHFFHGYRDSGLLHSCLDHLRQALAAGNFHHHHGNALYACGLKDLGKLFPVQGSVIKFRAADQHRLAGKEVPMKVRVGNRRTIGGHQEVGISQEGCTGLHQSYLYRPVGKLRLLSCRRCRCRRCRTMFPPR